MEKVNAGLHASITTSDGSSTLSESALNDSYHSCKGAVSAAHQVFIETGLKEAILKFGIKLNILEVGFGTGLNALLTFQEARKQAMEIWYTGIELHPVSPDLISTLAYAKASGFPEDEAVFERMHDLPWNIAGEITGSFILEKRFSDVRNFSDNPYRYHLVYFDAFAAEVQPEMWSRDIFSRIHDTMAPHGVLITVETSVTVQKMIASTGFTTDIIQPLQHGRAMLKATKRN